MGKEKRPPIRKKSDPLVRKFEWGEVPTQVQRVVERDLPVIPQTRGKHPPVQWKKYQKGKPPSRERVRRWQTRLSPRYWAIVTGRRGVDVLDFDGEPGRNTLERLMLEPRVRTPHGGAHVWVTGVPFAVVGGARVDEAHFPGLDIRADGQIATFYGDGYKLSPRAPIYMYDELPNEVRSLFRRRRKRRRQPVEIAVPEDFDDATAHQVLLGEALMRLAVHPGRNETGFWLACQLRDERYSQRVIWRTMRQYADHVSTLGDHAYTQEEAYGSMVSALAESPRVPRALRDEITVGFFSDLEDRNIEWLWHHQIPKRKISLIDGDPERGKSLVTLDLAARITTGEPMPGETTKQKPGAVIIITAEDDLADTVKPRLTAAGARLDRCAFVAVQKDDHGHVIPLSIPEDLNRIRAAIRDAEKATGLPVQLVVIDPVTAYLSESINYGNDPQVRKAMAPLKEMAEDAEVAVLLVRHLNKEGGLRAIYRGGGSIAFAASARSVLVADRHPDKEDTLVLARVKNNLAPPTRPRMYWIGVDPKTDAPRVEWGEEFDLDVEVLLHGPDARKDAPARREAERFLRDLLADGPLPSEQVEKAAKAAGLSWRTVKAAKASAGVRTDPVRHQGKVQRWEWSLANYVQEGTIHFDLERD